MNVELPSLDRLPFRRDAGQDGVVQLESPPESLVVSGAAIVAGVATRKCLSAAWKQLRKDDPPVNPAAQGVGWADALIWAVSVGAAIGVARVCTRRGVSAAARKYYY
jgi:hypothetical protein